MKNKFDLSCVPKNLPAQSIVETVFHFQTHRALSGEIALLNKLTIRTKLWSLVFAATIATFCVAGAALSFTYHRMYEDRVAKLQAVVEAGHSLASRLEAAVVAGKMAREEAQSHFKDELLAIRYSGEEYLFAHSFDQIGFAHPSPKLMGKDVSGLIDANGVPIVPALISIVKTRGEGTYVYGWPLRANDPQTAEKVAFVKGFAPWNIFIGTGVFIEDIRTDFMSMVWKVLGLTTILAVPAIGLIALVGSGVSGRLRRVGSKMKSIAEGDMAVDLPEAEQRDEIGEMARTIKIFRDGMIESRQLRSEQEEAKERAVEQRKQEMKMLATEFESTVGNIIETVSSAASELEGFAGTLSSSAERSQDLTSKVSAASREASTNVQSVASAAEQMASSVNEIGRQVQESAKIAGAAVEQAQKTNDRVNALSQAATRIGDVVDLINTIAGQTNLLALNATIEAARAGEAGRGFAVVASEVKALAEQTAKATGDISQQIAGIQAATQDSVAAIKEISGTIGRISEISSAIASAVEEQGAATQEISRNVQQAAHGTQQVASNITDVQLGASATGTASSQVLASAQMLSSNSARLKMEVGEFLNTVRAA
ncbi:methyl-accepting chemotaxis protein [Nitrobacteraceae bacterium AZCC 2161]